MTKTTDIKKRFREIAVNDNNFPEPSIELVAGLDLNQRPSLGL